MEMYGNGKCIRGFLEQISVIFSYHPLSSFIFHSFSIEQNPGSPATWKLLGCLSGQGQGVGSGQIGIGCGHSQDEAVPLWAVISRGIEQWISWMVNIDIKKWDFTRKNLTFFLFFFHDILMGDLSRDV